MFCFQNVGKLFLHFLNIKKIVCESPFSGIVDGERTQMWISLQMTHKNKFASLLYNLTRNHAVQFSLRWAVFNVAYNQKRGVSSFKLSPLVWFKVSSSPGCIHNAQTASWGWNWFDNLENIFYNLHLPYNLKPSRVKLGVKQVWHSSVQFKMSRFQTSV